MIPSLALDDWANTVAWANPDRLEQDIHVTSMLP